MESSQPVEPSSGGTSSAFFFGVHTTPNGQHANLTSPSTGKPERVTLAGKAQAAPRRIGPVWDDVDHVIFDYKNKGYSNKEVAEVVKQHGIDYDPKTIGTRYLRLKARNTNLEKQGQGPIAHRVWTAEEVR
jgi:hypothetical protein